MRDVLLSSAMVAALALGATSGPKDDLAKTKADRDVPIMVLLNDPSGSEITAVGATSSGLGTVTQVGDELVYTPNGFTGEDMFSYDTADATATVIVVLTSGQTTGVLPVADSISTAINTPIMIPVLDNDPEGTLLLGINNPPPDLPIVTRGRVAIVGNDVRYTPPQGFEGLDFFQYQTQSGSTLVSVNVVQSINDAPVLATVFLRNTTPFQVEYRIDSSPGVFIDCADPTQAFGFIPLGPAVAMEPFSEIELCIEVTNTTLPQSVTFRAEEIGVSNPREANPLPVNIRATQDTAITFNQERLFDVDGNLILDRVFLTSEVL